MQIEVSSESESDISSVKNKSRPEHLETGTHKETELTTRADQPLISVKQTYLENNIREIKNTKFNYTCEERDKRSELLRYFLSNKEFYHDTLNDVGKGTLITSFLK